MTHPGRRAYTVRGYTRRGVRRIPMPMTNLSIARDMARKWLARIGVEVEDDFGRDVVPMRVHSYADRLVRWAEERVR